jgi:hypothetical protein
LQRQATEWKLKHDSLVNENKEQEKTDTRLQILVSNFERLAYSGDMEFRVGEEIIQAHSAIGIIFYP